MADFEMPDRLTLSRLRQMGLTYREIGFFYDLPAATVRQRLQHEEPVRPPLSWHSPTAFWTAAGTVLALIRSGHVTLEALRLGLGVSSKSVVARFVEELVKRGMVCKTPGKVATLCLTSQSEQMGSLIILVRARPEGGLERYQGPRVRPRARPDQERLPC